MSKQLTTDAQEAIDGASAYNLVRKPQQQTEAEMSEEAGRAMDAAFQKFRAKHFGAYQAYPVDAYTYFCSGWKARDALR